MDELRAFSREQVINPVDAFDLREVNEAGRGTAPRYFLPKFAAGRRHATVRRDVRVKNDVHRPPLPSDAVEISDRAFNVAAHSPLVVCLADCPAPVPDAGNGDDQRALALLDEIEIEGERLLFPFGEDDRDGEVRQVFGRRTGR